MPPLIGKGKTEVAGWIFLWWYLSHDDTFVASLLLDVVLTAVLVPVSVMLMTAVILSVVCARHWRNKYESFSSSITGSLTFLYYDLFLCS